MILYQKGGKFPWMNKMPDLRVVPDTSFTKDKTEMGDIETFTGEHDTIDYPT